jgi:hypothetical protein
MEAGLIVVWMGAAQQFAIILLLFRDCGCADAGNNIQY